MTLDEAIEIVDTHQCDMPRDKVPKLIAAIKLLIEAGKRINNPLQYNLINPRVKLPGETEE